MVLAAFLYSLIRRNNSRLFVHWRVVLLPRPMTQADYRNLFGGFCAFESDFCCCAPRVNGLTPLVRKSSYFWRVSSPVNGFVLPVSSFLRDGAAVSSSGCGKPQIADLRSGSAARPALAAHRFSRAGSRELIHSVRLSPK